MAQHDSSRTIISSKKKRKRNIWKKTIKPRQTTLWACTYTQELALILLAAERQRRGCLDNQAHKDILLFFLRSQVSRLWPLNNSFNYYITFSMTPSHREGYRIIYTEDIQKNGQFEDQETSWIDNIFTWWPFSTDVSLRAGGSGVFQDTNCINLTNFYRKTAFWLILDWKDDG